jgi:hypothetical protein
MPLDGSPQLYFRRPTVALPIDLERVVAVDFETYFDKEYSLRSKEYNTSEYIRDPLFQVHCVGIKIGSAPTKVYWYDDVEPALREIDWSTHYQLSHHTHFDGMILSHHYGIYPAFYLDTLSQSRALHNCSTRMSLDAIASLYGIGNKLPSVLSKMKGHRVIPDELRADATAYTATDVDLNSIIYRMQAPVFPEAELRLIDLTVRMFVDPIFEVDLNLAQEELEAEIAEKAAKVAACGFDVDELQSAGKLAEVLRSLGVEPPMKISKRTKLETFAFSQQDEEFMALGAHEDERVRLVIEARLAVKSTQGETRARRFIKAGSDGRKLPAYLNYCGPHTTRWSGGDKNNLQNLERGGRLRRSIKAPPGHAVVVADSAQIEARTNAWFWEENELVEAFRSGADIYSRFATEIYGHEVNRKRKELVDGVETYPDFGKGFVGKVSILGLGYQMGPPRFQGTLALGIMGPKVDISLQLARHIVYNVYRKRYKKIVGGWRICEGVLYRMFMKRIARKTEEYHTFGRNNLLAYDNQSIWLPNGLGLHYPDLKGEVTNEETGEVGNYSYRAVNEYPHIYGGLLTENIIQALARVIVAGQMLEISDRWRVAMMSHDEIVCIAPKRKAEECLHDMIRVMSSPPAWAADLPLAAEGGFDQVYSK